MAKATTPKVVVVIKGAPEPCALTAQQDKLWDDTRAALMWNAPAFTHIFYTMMNCKDQKAYALFTKDVPIAATDGSALMLNPDTFFKYTLNERVFACAHEICHGIFNHCNMMHEWARRGKVVYPDGTSLPYIHELMNITMDLVINDMLIEGKVGAFNKDWLHDTSIATSKDSVVDAYKKVFKKCGGGKKGDRPCDDGEGPGIPGKRFDEHLEPGTSQGKDPTTAAQERNDIEWETQIKAAVAVGRAKGNLPAGLERLLGEVLNPVVDWKDKIRGLWARRPGAGGYDWQRADDELIIRDIFAPARSGHGAGVVVCANDTSGSIGDADLTLFYGEMGGILEDAKPKHMVVMWCDAKVHRVDDVFSAGDLHDLRMQKAPGGGGTDFRPVFAKIKEMNLEIDTLIYLTDGIGDFPLEAPPYTVIWASILPPGTVKYPFGEVVDVPKQA